MGRELLQTEQIGESVKWLGRAHSVLMTFPENWRGAESEELQLSTSHSYGTSSPYYQCKTADRLTARALLAAGDELSKEEALHVLAALKTVTCLLITET